MTQKTTLTLVISIVVGLVLAYLLFGTGNAVKPEGENVTSAGEKAQATSSGKKLITVGGITFETDVNNPGGIVVEQVPTGELPKPVPTLSAEVKFLATANVSPEAQKIIKTQVAELVKKLTGNPGVAGDWLSLGTYRKMAGEYGLAKEAWEYAKKLQPSDKTAYSGLADLYQYYLKNYSLAETNWKKTVELDAKFIAGYKGLYDLYTQNKQADKAKAILEAGLAKNPNSVDLLVMMGTYYKDLGEKAQAVTYFTKALAEAKKIPEDASLLPAIQAELDALK